MPGDAASMAVAVQPLAGRRVLILVENLPVPLDRRVWQEALALRDAGAAVTVICPATAGYPSGHERLEEVDVHRFPLPFEARGTLGYVLEYACALGWFAWHTGRLALRQGIDVVQACNPPDLLFLVAGLPKRLFGWKFVYDQHDINPELYEAKFGRRDGLYRVLLLLERLSYRFADAVIVTNESFREIALGRGRVAADRVFVVRSGPDLSRFRPVPPEPALKRGRRHLVGYVGVMGAQEGLDLLLAAARLVVDRRGAGDVGFLLVGDGTDRARAEAEAARLGLGDAVHFAGFMVGERLRAAICTMDVCVACDDFNPMNDKSTMNKVIEYMALGRPVVQFELTEGRRTAGEAALYARPGDPRALADRICELLDDEALRRRLGDIGRRRVAETLAWEHQVPQLIDAYRSV